MKRLYEIAGRLVFILSYPAVQLLVGRQKRAYLLLRCGDEVLLVKNWYGNGRWSLPGGGLHASETAELGLKREVMEEVGYDIAGLKLKGPESFKSAVGLTHKPCLVFCAEIGAKPDLRLNSFELTGAAWYRAEEITSLPVWPEVKAALQAF